MHWATAAACAGWAAAARCYYWAGLDRLGSLGIRGLGNLEGIQTIEFKLEFEFQQ
jgi:hypothetical protein